MDDDELNHLLREWRAPAAPAGMHVPRPASGIWAWLVGGSVRVPVPAFLAALALLTAAIWTGTSGPSGSSPEVAPRRATSELARHTLSGPLEGFDAVLVEMTFAPGTGAGHHRHPGPILGYVVDGEMRFGIDHETDRIIAAGGTFYEPRGALHTTFGASSDDAPVRCVAFLIVPTGSPLTERP